MFVTPKLVAVEIIALLPNLIKSSGREAAGETNNLLEIKFYFNINILGNDYSMKANFFSKQNFFFQSLQEVWLFLQLSFFPIFLCNDL